MGRFATHKPADADPDWEPTDFDYRWQKWQAGNPAGTPMVLSVNFIENTATPIDGGRWRYTLRTTDGVDELLELADLWLASRAAHIGLKYCEGRPLRIACTIRGYESNGRRPVVKIDRVKFI